MSELKKWKDYAGNIFLKPKNVKDDTSLFAVVGVEDIEYKDGSKLRLNLEQHENKFKFDLNKTNTDFLIEQEEVKLEEPKDIIGKLLTFRIVKANNPNTGKEVDSLRIDSVNDTPN